MPHLFSRYGVIALLVLCPLLALSGYRSGAEDAAPAVLGTDAAQGTPALTQGFFGSGSFNLPAPTVGLSDLPSYRATLLLSFKGTQSGQPEEWSRSYAMLTSQKPSIRQVTIDSAGKTPGQVFMAEINGVRYERKGENTCTASMFPPDGSLGEEWEPAGLLSAVIGADEVGSDMVNGVATIHYTFDERAIGQRGSTQSTGEMWIASEGGYVVKYTLVTKGNADYFGEDTEGTITWEYNLTDVSQPVTAAPPPNCPVGLVDAPLLPDATDKFSIPGVLTYNTPSSLAEATAFYQKQMPALGWKTAILPSITGTTAALNFTQGEQLTTITITVDSGITSVQIVLGSAASVKGIDLPTATNTLIPTRTKVPTRTPLPTRTPAPTRTKVPTRTPVPTKTP